MQRRNTIPLELEDRAECLESGVSKLPKELRNLFAGGIAGMVAKSVVAPFDRIKILYQVTNAEFRLRKVPSVARTIIDTEGWAALWKGNTATLIRVFPYSGIQFMVFDWYKSYYLYQHRRGSQQHPMEKWGLTPLESLFAGMIAGTVSVICTYPLDLTRAQLAVLRKHKTGHTPGFRSVLLHNYHRSGFEGLFRGITPTLLGILPYSGIAFALNEQGKRKIHNLTRRDLTTVERMQCGALAGLVAQTITYPIEVTRRRMQTIGLVGHDTAFGSVGAKVTAEPSLPPNLMTTIRDLYAEQGYRGFFKGVSVNWMKGPIAFSISFTVFDTMQGIMSSESERASRLPSPR